MKTKKEEVAFIITIDNPPVNALSPKVFQEIEAMVKQGNADPDTFGLIITGSGSNAFSAGGDLKVIQNLKPEDAASVALAGQRALSAIESSYKPVLAAVNGLALGGGNELAMSCDLRFASDRARFGQTEVTFGLIPTWGGTQRLSRLVGRAKAKELIFSGQIISAQEALRIGLVNKVVPDGEELNACMNFLRTLASKTSPLAVAQAKIAIDKGLQKSSLDEAMKCETEGVQALVNSSDLKEGIQAFIEKRPPKFTGK